MPRFAANLTMLFTEVPMLDRPGLAAQAGFDGVEVLFPYDHPVTDWQTALAGLPLALVNTPPGDWVSGDRGFAAVPGQEAQFRDSFLRGADLARIHHEALDRLNEYGLSTTLVATLKKGLNDGEIGDIILDATVWTRRVEWVLARNDDTWRLWSRRIERRSPAEKFCNV
jgi:hydroxypyruvate isomerase